jgi:hypothetical protein
MAAKSYEDGFEYGARCARTMSDERRAENARYVRASWYFLGGPTREYWRGFVAAMESTLVRS